MGIAEKHVRQITLEFEPAIHAGPRLFRREAVSARIALLRQALCWEFVVWSTPGIPFPHRSGPRVIRSYGFRPVAELMELLRQVSGASIDLDFGSGVPEGRRVDADIFQGVVAHLRNALGAGVLIVCA